MLPANRSMPDSMVVPVLAYRDPLEASAWLCQAFGFTERLRMANHRVQLAFCSGAVIATDRWQEAGVMKDSVRALWQACADDAGAGNDTAQERAAA